LERVVVADGCRLYQADLQECVIGLRSMIRPGAKLRKVVMMGADFYESVESKAENRLINRPSIGIGSNTSIERAIIDKNARIGRHVIIRTMPDRPDEDHENWVAKEGIVIVPKGAVIPDGTVI
jgi:glucose-1-phosphate adenylyltransferase